MGGGRIPIETEERIRDRYFVREILEVASVERIIAEDSSEVRVRLEDLGRKCDQIPSDSAETVRNFAIAHMDFHLAMAEYSRSTILHDYLKKLNRMGLMLWNRSGLSP